MKQRHNNNWQRRHFSLIEIMVVLIIIGLILGLAVPAVMNQLESAKQKAAKAEVLLLEDCVNSYYLDMNAYPDDLQALVQSSSKKWKGPYIEKGQLPTDPWGNDYEYKKSSSRPNLKFEIVSYGADGVPGGQKFDADIGNWSEEE